MSTPETTAPDESAARRGGVRRLFHARVPWLSALLVACLVGVLSWAGGSFSKQDAKRRAGTWTRGSVTLEEAVTFSLRGEGVIVDARPEEERERGPVRGGAIVGEPGGIQAILLESLREVPIYVLCSDARSARGRGLRLAKSVNDKGFRVEIIKAKQ